MSVDVTQKRELVLANKGNKNFTSLEIRKLRKNTLKVSREEFCGIFCISKALLESLESGRRPASPMLVRMMKLVKMGVVKPQTLSIL